MVSVIIPNYNHGRYLKQRIESVLNQTYQDFELIILDDKSTDNSKEVIERYRNHPKVSQIIYNEQNSGTTFKQWNKGIKLAKGELIWFAESDDAASEFFLEELSVRFKQNPNLGIVYCDSYYMNEHNENQGYTHIWKNERFNTNRWDNDYENAGVKEVNDFLFYHNVIDNASSALFKKEKIIEAGLADESYKYVGDLFLYMKILLISDVTYIAKPLNYFRQHPVNTSKISVSNGAKQLEEISSVFKISLNPKIKNSTVKNRYNQTLGDYRYFIYINAKLNRNISLLIKGHQVLLKSNFCYGSKFLTKFIFDKIFRNKS